MSNIRVFGINKTGSMIMINIYPLFSVKTLDDWTISNAALLEISDTEQFATNLVKSLGA